MQEASRVVVLISNGPGELATWVRPISEKLHSKILMRPRAISSSISLRLVLVPCPNATGKEKTVANNWKLFDQITHAKRFWNLLMRPQHYGNWPQQGLVVFLGGDQFWSVLLSVRLGYRHITYAEWVARWPRWNNRIAAMSSKVRDRIPNQFKNRCNVVGDLMADLSDFAKIENTLPEGKWIALMPGSKKAKLSVGVPFLLEVADQLLKILPNYKFLLPIAPTTNLEELQEFMSHKNPIAKSYQSAIERIDPPKKNQILGKLITKAGTIIHLQEEAPAHISLSQCELALTTVGANTAELGALGVPMIVLVPTQHLHVMQAWDGFLGILSRLPGVGRFIGFLLSNWRLRSNSFLAWPNISAGRMIVPEKIGNIFPEEIAQEAAEWLSSPERLKGQKEDLRSLRGQPGAVEAMTQEIIDLLPKGATKR